MPISTYSSFKTRASQQISVPFTKGGFPFNSATTSLLNSAWFMSAGNPAATPTTSAALNSASVGALNNNPAAETNSVVASASVNASTGQLALMLVDRLVHQGGLSGSVATAQTTNLPTAALTRYTDGVGVMVGLEIYTALGGTATTATLSYTNQAGTSGRTSKAVAINASLVANRFVVVPLADGDTGVRSVESVTLAATTGATGNFGVTLFKPICLLNPAFIGLEAYGTNNFNALLGGGCQFETVLPDACLAILAAATANSALATGNFNLMDIT